ncbi:Transcriptional regulator, GntR family [Roseibacterium elongatum DSM 19469]|uniref:Transcriptional regulator, GntR family n=1 Tax=Roseicyclus elongatus DSM 19469 TaxID=1294273 RepID=W8RWS9_9RHOB|nr:FCD domain-containing protein [Roseibacterium elongatum]AHM05808.1 Transcriptional regulator, GntR family [Roseibacterium elongatum DSM 19469]
MPKTNPARGAAPFPGATVKYVYETLSTRIVTQEYASEERLPSERQLAQDLGVARNTVREALDQLESRGLIRRRAGSGSFVTYDPEGQDAALAPVALDTGPLQLQVVRGILEPEMVRLAIVNMTPRQIEALSVVLSRMEAVQTDATAFVRLEEEFHRLLAEGTGNPLLLACYNLVLDARRQSFRTAMYRRHLTPARIAIYQRGYNGLFNAITARDIEEASEFMKLALIEDQRLLLQED